MDTEIRDIVSVLAAAEQAIKMRNRWKRTRKIEHFREYERLMRDLDAIINPPPVKCKKGAK